MSSDKFKDSKHAYGPNWIYFGKANIPYYQNDTEPKAFPDLYIVMVPAEMADRVVDDVQEKLDAAIAALEIADAYFKERGGLGFKGGFVEEKVSKTLEAIK